MKQSEQANVARRDFLRVLAGGAAGAAIATAAPLADEAAAAPTEADKRKARYHETEHVKTYYRVNRY